MRQSAFSLVSAANFDRLLAISAANPQGVVPHAEYVKVDGVDAPLGPTSATLYAQGKMVEVYRVTLAQARALVEAGALWAQGANRN